MAEYADIIVVGNAIYEDLKSFTNCKSKTIKEGFYERIVR